MPLAILTALGAAPIGGAAWAQSAAQETMPIVDFDLRHKACLEKIAQDADTAYEEAMIWQGDGGGRRARHCVAMSLFALGHADEAAFRLEKLAKAPDGGTPAMRADFYVESANLWLEAGLPRKAYDAASAGLKLVKSDADLRIVRARSYAAMERWDYAETDLSSALTFNPDHARALRYRADARLRQGKLEQARQDIDSALKIDGKDIDSLLVRGKINEAMRLEKLKTSAP